MGYALLNICRSGREITEIRADFRLSSTSNRVNLKVDMWMNAKPCFVLQPIFFSRLFWIHKIMVKVDAVVADGAVHPRMDNRVAPRQL